MPVVMEMAYLLRGVVVGRSVLTDCQSYHGCGGGAVPVGPQGCRVLSQEGMSLVILAGVISVYI
jgi:hypothetical protein